MTCQHNALAFHHAFLPTAHTVSVYTHRVTGACPVLLALDVFIPRHNLDTPQPI